MLSNNKTLDCALLKTPEKAFDDIDSSYIYSFINKDNQQGITRDINQKGYLFWLGGFFERRRVCLPSFLLILQIKRKLLIYLKIN